MEESKNKKRRRNQRRNQRRKQSRRSKVKTQRQKTAEPEIQPPTDNNRENFWRAVNAVLGHRKEYLESLLWQNRLPQYLHHMVESEIVIFTLDTSPRSPSGELQLINKILTDLTPTTSVYLLPGIFNETYGHIYQYLEWKHIQHTVEYGEERCERWYVEGETAAEDAPREIHEVFGVKCLRGMLDVLMETEAEFPVQIREEFVARFGEDSEVEIIVQNEGETALEFQDRIDSQRYFDKTYRYSPPTNCLREPTNLKEHEFYRERVVNTKYFAWECSGHVGTHIFPGGSYMHTKNNVLHRVDGPAQIFGNGGKEWWQDGKLHREHGPAVIAADGGKEWWQNGVKISIPETEAEKWWEIIDDPIEPECVEIPVENGLVKIDMQFLPVVQREQWRLDTSTKIPQIRSKKNRRKVLHRETIATVEKLKGIRSLQSVIFLNGDNLDYRLCNLRRK